VTLKYGSSQEIKKAVFDAVQILNSKGGFILSAVDQIFEDTPWRNVNIMMKAWQHECKASNPEWIETKSRSMEV